MTQTLTDPDLTAPQTAGPRFVVLRDGTGTHGVYDHTWDEFITSGWSYFEAATLRDDYNTRSIHGAPHGRLWC